MDATQIKDFIDIDAVWKRYGLVTRRGQMLAFVRSNLSPDAPNLKDMRFPGHLLSLVQVDPDSPLPGQPEGTRALALFKVTGSGGGLLIASFGPASPFDKRVESEQLMEITVW